MRVKVGGPDVLTTRKDGAARQALLDAGARNAPRATCRVPHAACRTPHRLVDAVAAGCVPVIVGDAALPFARFVDYRSFAGFISRRRTELTLPDHPAGVPLAW